MANRAKQILDTAVDVGKAAVSAAERRLRGSGETTSAEPSTVGAAKPGKPRGPKSATASTTSPSKPAKPTKDKTSTPRKRATGRRSTASRAAASSGKDVSDAASGED